jgi:hypothetical protein
VAPPLIQHHGGYGAGLKRAHRRPQYPAFYPWRVGTETLPHCLADAEFQLRAHFECVIGGRLEELVGQRELEDCSEGLPQSWNESASSPGDDSLRQGYAALAVLAKTLWSESSTPTGDMVPDGG